MLQSAVVAILEGAVGNFFSWGVMNRWERTVSFVITAPELISAAATDLAGIGSTISAANAAASASTTAVAAAAADEVSTAVATLFGAHAQQYQSLGSQMAAFHDDFVRILASGSNLYATAEATNASPLQPLLDLINAPTQAILGRPLIGNGSNGTYPGQDGRDGGLLIGNGGTGGTPGTGGSGGILIGADGTNGS